jgi:hypothetical protein
VPISLGEFQGDEEAPAPDAVAALARG